MVDDEVNSRWESGRTGNESHVSCVENEAKSCFLNRESDVEEEIMTIVRP